MDEDLKLVERLKNGAIEAGYHGYDGTVLQEASKAITRLHAEIEALKSDVSDLVRAGSDEATENERLVKERDEALAEIARRDAVAKAKWGDQADEHSEAISAAHPTYTKLFEPYNRALAMIGNRHGKYELVNLANWLLVRAETAEAQRDAALEALRPFANAAERINYFDGERYDAPLYAMPNGNATLVELLNGREGEPLTVETLRAETIATITRLHATITQMTNTIDGLEFQREEAMWREADSRGVWAKLTQEQVDRAETAEAQRDAALEALRPFANAYAVLKRRGYLVAPNGTALMYDPQNPKFLGPFIEDLARAHRVYEGGEG